MVQLRSMRKDFLQIAAIGVAATSMIAILYTLNKSEKVENHLPVVLVSEMSDCQWEFLRYEPSKWEQEWAAHVEEWSDPGTGDLLCQKMREAETYVAAWLKKSSLSQEGCGQLDSRLDDADVRNVFSRYVYQNSCTGEEAYTFIEPLVGLVRHPRAICSDSEKSTLINRSYMILGLTSTHCFTRMREPASLSLVLPDQRVMLFDLGASLYSSGFGGASQKWFDEMLRRHGVNNLEYWGWEAEPLDPVEVWSQIPVLLKPQYHWMNIPANPDPNSSDNPWNFIRALAKKSDRVIVKLDIDNSKVEEEFMKQIRGNKNLQDLIDEMFFEHHVNVDLMNPHWKTQNETQHLSDTYELFGWLRRSGMRFHGWP